MEGLPVWNPSASETLQEWMRRLNLVRRKRIAILNEETDCKRAADAQAAAEAATVADTEAAVFLSDDDSNSDEDLWEAAPFQIPLIAARIPMPLPGFGWGEGGFIPGRGFAQIPVHPAPRAQLPAFQPQTLFVPHILPCQLLSNAMRSALSRYLQVSMLEAVL